MPHPPGIGAVSDADPMAGLLLAFLHRHSSGRREAVSPAFSGIWQCPAYAPSLEKWGLGRSMSAC